MSFRNALWTYAIVTAVTMLIWVWAAGATRQQSTQFVNIRFEVTTAGRWNVQPQLKTVTVKLEGSAMSIGNAEGLLGAGVSIDLLAAEGKSQRVNLLARLRDNEDLLATGVTVISVEESMVDVELDAVGEYTARIRPDLPGVKADGEVEIKPPLALVRMPSKLLHRSPEDLVVDAFVDPSVLAGLEPGVRHKLDARLRLPDFEGPAKELDIVPATVEVSFTVKSRISQSRLESVRVHLAGPHKDFLEYDVQLSPDVLRNVTISAESELIKLIEADEATVVALLHLSNREKDVGIDRKAVAYFVAIQKSDGQGSSVQGRVEGTEGAPVIDVTITRREE